MKKQYFKVVTAWPMDQEDPAGGPNIPGYCIESELGYITWTPRGLFEKEFVSYESLFPHK